MASLIPRTFIFSIALVLCAIAACSAEPPRAADVRSVHEASEPAYRARLSREDQRQVEAAFEALARDRAATSTPMAARGIRWRDVELAAAYACDEIEAALVQRVEHADRWEFRLRTVEDWPGRLTVHRLPPREPDDEGSSQQTTRSSDLLADECDYEAEAQIGWYGERTERAEALLQALDEQLRGFARKERLREE